ncbi:MAG: elongation factor P lysine(34) lysyltransferase [SAR86 cluster bacterium]|uniref:Elongation factor P lysine(34) lysyltransferase n=1 Tax=SAR86 cluster bacterium TaxID=2030880 RepID=A0A2A5CHP5_9GAMM|nr:MAG: elongation factor P lysine(34) lysyltransferase [SAR86 cluster bacterium]
MRNEHWRPRADKDRLFARATLLKNIRAFFEQRNVLEVETPVLSHAAGTDPNLDSISATYRADSQQAEHNKEQTLFLQTSPEFAMKRLLADGSGAIFQICKAFRNAEQGARHNPEFTLLEWYQPDFDEHQLMDEVMTLLMALGQSFHPQKNFSQQPFLQQHWHRLTYQSLFEQYLNINPHTISSEELARFAKTKINIELEHANKDIWLDLLFSHSIEPLLLEPVFIYEYPATQAALATIEKNMDGIEIARRFELVINGMEIANGYYELTDVDEQRRRFLNDQKIRQEQKKANNPLDENLLAAMAHGLPACAGVALGLDRLLMLICGADSIDEVLAFSLDRA